jgi:hypothetical protein
VQIDRLVFRSHDAGEAARRQTNFAVSSAAQGLDERVVRGGLELRGERGAIDIGRDADDLGANGNAAIVQNLELLLPEGRRYDDELRHDDGDALARRRHVTDAQHAQTAITESFRAEVGELVAQADEDARGGHGSLDGLALHLILIESTRGGEKS